MGTQGGKETGGGSNLFRFRGGAASTLLRCMYREGCRIVHVPSLVLGLARAVYAWRDPQVTQFSEGIEQQCCVPT